MTHLLTTDDIPLPISSLVSYKEWNFDAWFEVWLLVELVMSLSVSFLLQGVLLLGVLVVSFLHRGWLDLFKTSLGQLVVSVLCALLLFSWAESAILAFDWNNLCFLKFIIQIEVCKIKYFICDLVSVTKNCYLFKQNKILNCIIK